jgi:tryptophan halogenase
MFRFVIIGGGTAGWVTALTLKKYINCDVVVIASSEIGILGAGEGVTPHFNELMNDLDIPMDGIFDNAKATVKAGIKFTNWNGDDTNYFHPFWDNKTAVHFDASLLAKHLQGIALERGVTLIDDQVIGINSNNHGDITSFTLKNNSVVDANFVFDCSGLHRLIIGKHFNVEWNSYDHMLPCNRALPFFIQSNDEKPEYTESIAMKYGWVWRIPVEGRYGCGYVFDKRFVSDEEAIHELKEKFGDITIPRAFEFKAGAYNKTWVNNCVAIGLSAGFTEPLEATSIWIQILSLRHFLLQYDAFVEGDPHVVNSYNEYIKELNTYMAEFIHTHYLTKRNDSEFWKTFRELNKSPTYVSRVIDLSHELEQHHLDYVQMVHRRKYESPVVVKSWDTIINGVRLNG